MATTYKKTTSKYTKEQNSQYAVCTLGVLNESTESMTIDEIKNGDMALAQVSVQKMARVLNELVEAGFVKKAKGANGKMKYMSVAVMLDLGYEV